VEYEDNTIEWKKRARERERERERERKREDRGEDELRGRRVEVIRGNAQRDTTLVQM